MKPTLELLGGIATEKPKRLHPERQVHTKHTELDAIHAWNTPKKKPPDLGGFSIVLKKKAYLVTKAAKWASSTDMATLPAWPSRIWALLRVSKYLS
jgi:hypothetical protein